MSRSAGRPPSQRQLRVAEQLRHALAEAMRHGNFRDPELAEAASITVSGVDVSPDLRNALAYVVPLGGTASEAPIKALNRAAGYFRQELARAVRLKYTPELRFAADTSFDEAQRIEGLLRQTAAERAEEG